MTGERPCGLCGGMVDVSAVGLERTLKHMRRRWNRRGTRLATERGLCAGADIDRAHL